MVLGDLGVLNGVGVGGVIGISNLFHCFFVSLLFCFSPLFFFFLRFSLFFFVLRRLFPIGQEQTTAFYLENGEFHSDPVCTDPVQNFPTIAHLQFYGDSLRARFLGRERQGRFKEESQFCGHSLFLQFRERRKLLVEGGVQWARQLGRGGCNSHACGMPTRPPEEPIPSLKTQNWILTQNGQQVPMLKNLDHHSIK